MTHPLNNNLGMVSSFLLFSSLRGLAFVYPLNYLSQLKGILAGLQHIFGCAVYRFSGIAASVH